MFDLWVQQWRKQVSDDVVVVRFADDIVVGFRSESQGRRFVRELGERFAKFGLTLHPDKTRLIAFGRFADADRQEGGQGKPETFDLLGFTHMCGKTRRGKFVVRRKTARKKLRAQFKEVKEALRRRWNWSVPRLRAYLGAVVRGHTQYFGVPFNSGAIINFRFQVSRIWPSLEQGAWAPKPANPHQVGWYGPAHQALATCGRCVSSLCDRPLRRQDSR